MGIVEATAVRWVETVWRRRVTATRRLTGGWTSSVLRLTAADGEEAVLRLMTKEPWRRHAAGLLTREADVQARLGRSSIPVPRSLALDPSGAEAGVPAHLMSYLPGRLRLDDVSTQAIGTLADLLVTIHRFDPGSAKPREFQSWAGPDKRVVPRWARRPDLWERAFEELDRPAPAYVGTFLHRDFHLGNVLWTGERISGVVDWVETSWGPAHLDVAHAATYLAMLHGTASAAGFTDAYRQRARDRPDDDEVRYWNIMDIVGYLPDPAKVVQPWRDHGLTIGHDLTRVRLEQRLEAVLDDQDGVQP
ncbi:aminoglycoside phosphotransferase family protein [Polymorphospora sp. NPDC050346]|uniref:phosphotransferase family protein n=1 Tax=Polymorphospora sp. NPDC050346 TaxID=3155780 RepID=UPI0033F64E03